MRFLFTAHVIVFLFYLPGCSLFVNKRESEIRERLQKIQEEIDRRADSVRQQKLKEFNDSAGKDLQRSLDSIKRSSDSLERNLKKNIEELKNKK